MSPESFAPLYSSIQALFPLFPLFPLSSIQAVVYPLRVKCLHCRPKVGIPT